MGKVGQHMVEVERNYWKSYGLLEHIDPIIIHLCDDSSDSECDDKEEEEEETGPCTHLMPDT